MTGSGSAAQERRLLVATAVAHYPKAPQWDRPGLATARQQVIDLFTGALGYAHVSDLGLDPTETQLTEHLRTLCRHHVRPEDHLVVYIAGHGEVLDDGGGRHVLLTADTDPDDVADALPTLRLADKMLLGTPVQRLLLLLDTCYSGSGGNQVAAAVLAGMEREWAASGSGLVVVTSTQPFEQAETGAFPALLSAVVDALSTAGQVPPSLDLGGVVQAMNSHPERPPHQRIGWTALGLTGTLPDFLPNPRHRSGMTDIDLHLQQAAEWDAHAQRREVEFRLPFLVRAMATQGSAQAWWFSGRHLALTDITTWLTHPLPQQAQPFPQDVSSLAATPEPPPLGARALVVTAGPGSGKTAVLGLVSALTHPEHRPTVPIDAIRLPPAAIPPIGAVDVTIYADGLTHDQVQAGLAAAAQIRAGTIGELITALDARATKSGRPFTAIVDALDEAADPAQLITRVLRPVIDHAHGVRLLLGTRRHLLKLLQPPGTPARVGVIDLDAPRWADRQALTVYTIRNLIEASTDSPYRNARQRQAWSVADAVADAADPSFLVARIISTTLAAADTIADPTDPHWRASLPRLPGDAMRKDLDTRLGPDAARARDLLRPLAYAEGQGLPWEDIWAPLASRISGHSYTNDDLHWLRQHAGSYVVEATEASRSTYRLYHQALTEHLRAATAAAGLTDAAIHQAYADVLTARVPRTVDATRDWAHAHPYTLHHLATHAAAAGTLDPLLNDAEYLVHADPGVLDSLIADPGFLVAAEPVGLMAALDSASSPQARHVAWFYRIAADGLRTSNLAERAAYLQLAAGKAGDPQMAEAFGPAAASWPWTTHVLSWRSPGRYTTLGRTGRARRSVLKVTGSGEVLVITIGDDGTVRLWRLSDGWMAPAGDPQPGHDHRNVTDVAVGQLAGQPVAVTGADDGTMQLWRLSEDGMVPAGDPQPGHGGRGVSAVAVGQLAGQLLAVSYGHDRMLRMWRLSDDGIVPIGDPQSTRARTPRPSGAVSPWVSAIPTSPAVGDPAISAFAVGQLAGLPVAVTVWGNGTVGLWRLSHEGLVPVGPPQHGYGGIASHVGAVGQLAGQLVAVTGADDGTMQLWRLSEDGMVPVGAPQHGHGGDWATVSAVAIGQLAGQAVAVTCGWDSTVRLWRLGDEGMVPVGPPQHGHGGRGVAAVALGQLDGQAVAVTCGHDGTVASWRLRGEQPGAPDALQPGSDVRSAPADAAVSAAAVGQLAGRPVAVTGADDGTVRLWRIGDGELVPVGDPQPGHKPPWLSSSPDVPTAVVGLLAGRLVAVTGGDDGTVRLWRLSEEGLAPVGAPQPAYGGHGVHGINAVAVGEFDGQPVAVTAGGTIRLWRLGEEGLIPLGFEEHGAAHPFAVSAVAVGLLGDRPVALTGGGDRTVRLWRVGDEGLIPLGRPEPSRTVQFAVRAAAIGQPGGRALAVTGGGDGTVALWQIGAEGLVPVGDPQPGHDHPGVWAVAIGQLNGLPVAVTGGGDGAIQLWRLGADGLTSVPNARIPAGSQILCVALLPPTTVLAWCRDGVLTVEMRTSHA